jgi:hypothetical protein
MRLQNEGGRDLAGGHYPSGSPLVTRGPAPKCGPHLTGTENRPRRIAAVVAIHGPPGRKVNMRHTLASV